MRWRSGWRTCYLPLLIMQRRVEECLALVGLSMAALANPHELSAGEQQRLAIASALAAKPSPSSAGRGHVAA